MTPGAALEIKTLAYLERLFPRLGYPVTEARRQTAGTQNGFDIRISFLDTTGRERRFYFECKDYTTPLSWNTIAAKVFQLHASSHRPDAFIAISPHVNLSNGDTNVIEKLQSTIQTPIRIWSPNTRATHDKLKGIIKAILQQKDELTQHHRFPKELTLQIPRLDPGDVIGRDTDLLELHRLLFGKNNHVAVINGMGGIGKTTLAQAYLSKYYQEYAHIAWVTRDITTAIGLPENLGVPIEESDAEALLQEILRRMKALPDGPNLLVLDNAEEDLSELKDYLPGKPHWHVLATSRQHIEGFYPIELDFLSPENAIALFKKHCPLIKEDHLITELIAEVDYHTLTIEILAKTALLQRQSIQTLRDAIKKDYKANVYVRHKGKKIDKVFSYISSIFNCSGQDEDQQWLLRQFACLPTQFHPYGLLLELIQPNGEHQTTFPETCTRLAQQGWLLYDPEADAYKMHVIVQEVARAQLQPAVHDVAQLMENIAARLYLDDSEDNPVHKFKWVPFGQALLNTPDISTDRSRLQYHLGRVLHQLGDYNAAKVLFEKSMASDIQNFGPDDPQTVNSYTALGLVLRDMGDYDAAKALFGKAVASDERNFGRGHYYTSDSYSNLAIILQDLGDYTGALRLYKKAVTSSERHFGPDHPDTAVSYSNLALVLKSLGDLAAAKTLLQKAVASDERNFGPDHPKTIEHSTNLATVLKNLGDYPAAKALLEKAAASADRNLGPNHPTTAVIATNLANVLKNLGDHAGAKILFEQAIISAEHHLGPDHPTTALRYMNLATLLPHFGDCTRALDLITRSIAIFKKTLPPDHPHISAAQQNQRAIKAACPGT